MTGRWLQPFTKDWPSPGSDRRTGFSPWRGRRFNPDRGLSQVVRLHRRPLSRWRRVSFFLGSAPAVRTNTLRSPPRPDLIEAPGDMHHTATVIHRTP